MLPPLPARKSYDDVPRDSLAYALFLNPLMEVDPLDNNNDEPPTLKTLTARLKHMPGKHDQSSHGRPGRVGSAFRGAYSAARAGGASHVEARNQAKTAAEQVRETMRGEKRAERIANPKPKRGATLAERATAKAQADAKKGVYDLPHKDADLRAPDMMKHLREGGTVESYAELEKKADANLTYVAVRNLELDRIRNEQRQQETSALTPAQRARVAEANAIPLEFNELRRRDGSLIDQDGNPVYRKMIDAHTELRTARTPEQAQQRLDNFNKAKAAYEEYVAKSVQKTPGLQTTLTNDQIRQERLVQAGLVRTPPRAETPTTPPRAETPATPTTPTRAVGDYPRPKVGETVAQHLDRLYQHRAAIISKDDAIPREEQLALLSAGRKRKTNITPAEQAELDKAAREIARIERKIQRLEVSRTDQAGNPTKAEREVARQEVKANMPTELLQRTTNNLQRTLDSGIDPKTKRKLTKAQRDLYTLMVNGNRAELARRGITTKADDSVGGTPRKYGARAGEVIAGNLGRDTGGKFTRVGEDATSIIRAAINRGFASAAGGGKRGAKRAAVSDAQKKRQQADTGAGVMDKLGFDASDWDYLASDKPQDASDPQFTRLIEQGLMDNIDGMAYPSALGRKVAAAAGAGNEDKAKELLARDTAKRSARQAKMDAQISAYDEVINDETASPRARAIAARRRTMLIGQSGTSTKADDGYTPPAGVRAQAKRGLALRSEFGRGGTSVGIARARDLSNGKRMSRDTIMRMVSFFARHAVDKRPDWGNPSKPSNGYIAHLLWGGDAGKSWANKIANQIKAGE